MKSKVYQFYHESFFQTFFFLPNWTRDDIIITFKIDPDADGQGMVFDHNGAIFIWIKDFNDQNLGYLVHEATHAVNCMFQLKGVKISTKNDETQAYMNQWVFDKCRAYKKRKK